jgi:hypothetical protein
VVYERWYSKDLQMMVKTMNSDPRYGVTTYDLTNISQNVPDATLFQALPATPLPNRPARAAAAAEAVARHVCASLLNSRCCAKAHSQGGTTVTV